MLRGSFLVLLFALTSTDEAKLTLTGELPRPVTMRLADLKAVGAVTVEWTEPRSRGGPRWDGHSHKVTGVPLDKVLEKAGFPRPAPWGKDVPVGERRSGRKAVIATALYGSGTFFTANELFPEVGGRTRAVIAWEIDGQPLGPEDGPLRLVVTTGDEQTRSLSSLRHLIKIEVAAVRTLRPR
jgi:DMSO/TMAO reductase YedYZ molybdopterin-dependent catalytic subunit